MGVVVYTPMPPVPSARRQSESFAATMQVSSPLGGIEVILDRLEPKSIIEAPPVMVKVAIGTRSWPEGEDGGDGWPEGMDGKTDGDRD